MRYNAQQIAEAQTRLQATNLTSDEREHLTFVTTGVRTERSPRQDGIWAAHQSNCSFFHVQNVPCTLVCQGVTYEGGTFSHPDHSPVYLFVHQGQTYVLRGGANLNGVLTYSEYQPAHLQLTAGTMTKLATYESTTSQENLSQTASEL